MIRRMRDLTVGVFNHIKITSNVYVDKIIKYMQRVLRGTALNKYKQLLGGSSSCLRLYLGISIIW